MNVRYMETVLFQGQTWVRSEAFKQLLARHNDSVADFIKFLESVSDRVGNKPDKTLREEIEEYLSGVRRWVEQ